MFSGLNVLREEPDSLKVCHQTYLNGYFTIVIALLLLPSNLTSQISSAQEYQLKAAYIHNFTRFVNWPAAESSISDVPFVISVLNDDHLAEKIRELVKGEQLGSRQIVVKGLGNRTEIGNSNILYLAAQDALEIKDQLSAINRRGILTVSDAPNFSRWGGIIRFFKEDDKLRMQINIAEARASRIDISSKLLSISSIYSSN